MFGKPMKFLFRAALSAAFVLLFASQAVAQQTVPWSHGFNGITGANGNGGTASGSSQGSLESAGFKCFASYTNGYPHVVNNASNLVYYTSGTGNTRSLAFPAQNNTTIGTTGYALMPTFAVPLNSLKFKCWMATSSSSLGTLSVGYVTGDNSSSFVAIESFNADASSYCSSGGAKNPSSYGRYIEVDLSSAPSTATRIAVRWHNSSSSIAVCCIDDLEVFENPDLICKPVNTLTATTDYTTASLSWNDNNEATQWQVSFNGGTPFIVSTPYHTFTGLTPNTSYTATVRSICGAGDTSAPAPVTFSTVGCYSVTDVTSTTDYTSATLTWTETGLATQWRVSLDGGTPVTAYNPSYTFTGLAPNTTYTASVVAVCYGGLVSDPVTHTFTTATCVPVSALTATPDYASATLSWGNPAGVTQWQVSLDGGAPATVYAPTYTFTGLSANTAYTATVRAVCAAGVYSDWTSVDFQTICPVPASLTVSGIDDGTLHLSWQGSASQYEVQLASDAAFSAGLQTTTATATTATFTSLTMGEYYYVRARAVCGSDNSDWSNTLFVYMPDFNFNSVEATGLYPAEGKVVLNDLEPHDWAIYTTAVDKPLRTLDPVDAKITYRGYGTNNVSGNLTFNSDLGNASGYVPVQPATEFTLSSTSDDVSVGISNEERQYHTFEYYKTLERVDGKTAATVATGRVEYQTIFNPFSRRPAVNPEDYDWATLTSSNGAPCFRGFYKWRLDRISGGSVYTSPTGGTALAVGDLVPADQKLYFECTAVGIEVDFTAMWAPAAVRAGATVGRTPSAAYGADSVGTERNFLVIHGRNILAGSTYGSTNDADSVIQIEAYPRAVTVTSVFPNGTIDGVTPAYGPQKTTQTTERCSRPRAYIELTPENKLDRYYNRLIQPRADVRFEYVAFSRLRGEGHNDKKGFHLDGSHSAWWGTISAGGNDLTLGRGIEPMFDDNKGTFNYIMGVGPDVSNSTGRDAVISYSAARNNDNEALNVDGQKMILGRKFHTPSTWSTTNNYQYTIRLESGYVGCVMTIWGWNYGYQDQEGKSLGSSPSGSTTGEYGTPPNRLNGDNYRSRFIMGCDFDRADEAQQVRNLGTDYASRLNPRGEPYETLDSMLYHEVYKNAKTKIYRPFRVSSFNMQMNSQHKDSVYSDVIIKSGFVGQESIDRQMGHADGATGQSNAPRPRVIVDGIERGQWLPHSIYNVASNNNNHRGKRRMRIEGGFINSSVSLGAWDRTNDLTRWKKTSATATSWGPYNDGSYSPNDVSTLRMTGGHITGSVFGGGNTYTASGGGRQLVITGGTVRAWIAGGVNGSDAQNSQWEGVHFGNAWIYAGGTLHVGSGDTTHTTVGDTVFHPAFCGINGTTDGQIFGAGCGMRPNYYKADSVEIDHQWNTYAWKMHRMGRVDSSFVYIADQAEVEGDVYGGGNYGYNNTEDDDDDNWRGTGAYSNAKGKATMRVLGGTIGGRLFGGANMKMGREVDILMTGGHIKRGLFGGSNTWGYIKKDVIINIEGGTIGTAEAPAIVCGGGLGKETAVFGNVTLNIGAAGTAGPTIYGDVYGGSMNGTTNAGSATKTLLGTFNQTPNHGSGGTYTFYQIDIDTSTHQGYGYNSTQKTVLNIRSGLVDGNVFGGGFGPNNAAASTYGDITLNFLGGEVMKNIYGCNDASGKPMGKVKVNIGTPDSVAASAADGDRSHRNRPVVHGNVFGGGRDASYGHAPDNYTPVVEMFSGTVQNVFGGGEGNTAVLALPNETYATKVLVRHGTVRNNVYGGGNDAKVQGDTRVVIGGSGTLASFTLTVNSNNPSYGTVTGGGSYTLDEDAVIRAVSNAGYRFRQWNDGNTSNPRTISVKENATYTAEFEVTPTYTITVVASPSNLATTTGSGSYKADQFIPISATAKEGARFTGWSDGIQYNPRHVTVTGNATYTANFVAIPKYTLTVLANNNSYGTVTGSGEFYENELTSIRATPASGYLFRRWNDGNTENPRPVRLTANTTYTAIFEIIPTWTITVAHTPSGAGDAWISASGAYTDSYLEGTKVGITSEPATGYRFVQWDDGNTDQTRTITVTGNTTYTAQFEAIPQYNITVAVASGQSARGTVTGGGTYYENTKATLRAQPNPGYRFARWNDGEISNPRSVTVTANATFTAEFEEFHVVWVDLGLPSGKLWAEVNVGANNPEDYGDFFAWGETAPKTTYNWGNYAYGSGQYALTKYVTNPGYGSTYDHKAELEAIDDAATVNFGAGAYTPTSADWQELNNNTYTVNTTRNGVRGHLITGPNGNSIFLPLAGMSNGSVGSYGYYWSATLHNTNYNAYYQYLQNSTTSRSNSSSYRCNGLSVRAVRNDGAGLTQYTINAVPANASQGSVTGGGTYGAYTRIALRAVPTLGYRFRQWSDGNTDNPRSVTVTGNATYTAQFEEYELNYIDLGLPSGTLWAEANLGATAPEEYGDYIAWGELEAKNPPYDWTTYKFSQNGTSTMTKYNAADGLTMLLPEDDIASHVLGTAAYIPTYEQWQELKNNTTYAMETVNGILGVRYTSRHNGNSIFLPYAGYKAGTGSSSVSTGACYWSSTRHASTVYLALYVYMNTNSSGVMNFGQSNRYQGFSVRPVAGETKQITVLSANASQGFVSGGGTYSVGRTVRIQATPAHGYEFVQWSDGNRDNPRNITVTGNATYTASFAAIPTVPYYTGFEAGEDVDWKFNNNNYTNKWYIGTAAAQGGSKGLYVSNNNGTSNTYSNSGAYIYAYRTMSFTAGSHTIAFHWRGVGESSCDYIMAFLVPSNQTPSGDRSYSSSYPSDWLRLTSSPTYLYNQSDWQTFSSTVYVPADGNYHVVFYWRNDGSVLNNPAAAVDNVMVYKPGSGNYTITGQAASGQSARGSVSGGGSYAIGTFATLTAVPATGYVFKRWSDGNTSNPRSVGVVANATYTAEFETNALTWVDLGLPSGKLWADRNLGAANVQSYGDYYRWGELTPCTSSQYSSFINYRYGSTNPFTKYNPTDAKTTLEAVDDVATLLYGTAVHTPTKAEFDELIAGTTSEDVTVNGVKGRRLTSRYNGNSIFLPYTGYNNGNVGATNVGYFWSSSRCSSDLTAAIDYVFSPSDHLRQYGSSSSCGESRGYSFVIRAVKNP